jgi:uncharacterized SAM-binding protein YcdF (DUF218 family)
MRKGIKLCVFSAAALLMVLLTGFVAFTHRIDRSQPVATRPADGIVVLTGGAARVAEGLHLLVQGKARRLLISGVNVQTSKEALRRTLRATASRLFECCVDIGRDALDTIGNAEETRVWASERGFTSLIVVTASYHMPRSLAEIGHALPGVVLIPYPVTPPNLHVEAWWSHPGTAQVLFHEYLKYLAAAARLKASDIILGAMPSRAGSRITKAMAPPPVGPGQ